MNILSLGIRFSRRGLISFFAVLLFAGPSAYGASTGILQIRNGYFWDPYQKEYYFPRGVAYQTWNPPVGANQTLAQIEYDLTEFKKIYANSVRCELVWSQLQIRPDAYDWSKADFLIKKAEELGLRLFILIGFQYPPPWFPSEWRALNDRGERSDVLNYESSNAWQVYTNYIATVVARYKESPAIAAWILGNEFAYFDLWEDPAKYPVHRFLGYDSDSQASFREFLRGVYRGDIQELNANWQATFQSFAAVQMPARYPSDRHLPGYHDLIQWRKGSIGKFVAGAAKAAKAADPNHLITYSMVGGIFSGTDANNTAEDAKEIVSACQSIGAPLDFWAVNNYAWASTGSEMRSADFGIAKYQEAIGLPVLISETGHSSTENILGPGAAERQPNALPSQLWEAVMSGAIGFHFFHWSDRNMFTTNYFYRERGFGIVSETRIPKQPVYSNIVALLRRMEELKIEGLLGGSASPPHEILFYWSRASDMGWPRANQENAMIWGALKRLGYQPGIIDDEHFANGAYTNAAAVLLSRAYQLSPSALETITSQVIPRGIHVHANADLPGQFNAYHQPNPNWLASMKTVFGLDVGSADPAWDSGATDSPAEARLISIKSATNFGSIDRSFASSFYTWKIWHAIRVASGTTVLTHTGLAGSQPSMPALHFNDHGTARTAINTFALGDTYSATPLQLWDVRYRVLGAIYRDYFGITPKIELRGSGSQFVIPDYRICRDGSVLLSLMNEHTGEAEVEIYAPSLLTEKTVENLTSGGLAERSAAGQITVHLRGDEFLLLYAYPAGTDSLIADRSKIAFQSVPVAVWPNGDPTPIQIAYRVAEPGGLRVRLEQVSPVRCVRAQSDPVSIAGEGVQQVAFIVPDPNLSDTNYVSSRDGGEYRITVSIEKEGVIVNEISLPVRVLWPILPRGLPSDPVAGQIYQATLEWQELPSYLPQEGLAPIDRAWNWDNLNLGRQYYELVLQLHSGNEIVTAYQYITSNGSGTHPLSIQVPVTAKQPLHWSALARPLLEMKSVNFFDGFEGRERGAKWANGKVQDPGLPPLTSPWVSYKYGEFFEQVQWQNEGVNLEGRGGGQAAFLVVTNNLPGRWAGFGLRYDFPANWALPVDRKQWTNFSFSADFYENQRLPALVEIQLKNNTIDNRLIHYTQVYQPGADGWYHIEATVDQFVNFDAEGTIFDPTNVGSIVVNVQMLQPKAQYVAFFDNIRFVGPVEAITLGPTYGFYSSDNDSKVDSGGDPDLFFDIDSISRTVDGLALLSWAVQPNRSYAVYYSDEVTFTEPRLLSVGSITRGRQGTEDFLQMLDLTSHPVRERFYRIAVTK